MTKSKVEWEDVETVTLIAVTDGDGFSVCGPVRGYKLSQQVGWWDGSVNDAVVVSVSPALSVEGAIQALRQIADTMEREQREVAQARKVGAVDLNYAVIPSNEIPF